MASKLPQAITQIILQRVEFLFQTGTRLLERAFAEMRFGGIELHLTSVSFGDGTTTREQCEEASADIRCRARSQLTERGNGELRLVSAGVEHPLRETAVVQFSFEHPDRREHTIRVRQPAEADLLLPRPDSIPHSKQKPLFGLDAHAHMLLENPSQQLLAVATRRQPEY